MSDEALKVTYIVFFPMHVKKYLWAASRDKKKQQKKKNKKKTKKKNKKKKKKKKKKQRYIIMKMGRNS